MEIPYTIKPREDTGVYNAKLGIWLFLSSELMLFGSLFSSYVLLRVNATEWPRSEIMSSQVVALATLNTIILISSSITMIMGWASLVMKKFSDYKLWMGLTILLGIAFLCIKGYEYNHKFHEGLFPKTNTFLAIYFTMTGVHVLHLIGGVLVNLYFWGPGSKMWETQPERFINRIEIGGLYWHFVDLMWLFLFPVLYLI
jgi:cytochrome c oxidase subunit 3